VLDYRSDPAERGKNLGDDLAEGKPTLPLIYTLRTASESDRALIRSAIEKGGLDHLDAIIEAIESSGGLEYTMQMARQESEASLSALSALPDSDFKKGLAALARFAVERTT